MSATLALMADGGVKKAGNLGPEPNSGLYPGIWVV